MRIAFIFVSLLQLVFFLTSCDVEGKTSPITSSSVDSSSAVEKSPRLWSVEAVHQYLETAERAVVFEVSKTEKYEEGHLEKGYNIWRPDYEDQKTYPYGGMMADRQQMARLLTKYGVLPTDTIILYDTKGSADAMRVLWILTNYGHTNAIVMDGGKTAWKQAGFNLFREPSSLPETTKDYHFPQATSLQMVAVVEDVLAAITDSNVIILDTRDSKEFLGTPYVHKGEVLKYKKGAYNNGCIPGAIHLNWASAVDLDADHCFKSLRALRYNFEQKGISPDKHIITYCQSGVRSAHTTFVLTELLDYPNVKNYDGSWIEWSYLAQEDVAYSVEQHTSAENAQKIFDQLLKKRH